MNARWSMFAAGLAAVGSVLAMSAAEAQDGGSGTIGIGAAIVPEFDGSDEGQLIPLIVGRYDWRGRSIAFEQTAVKLDLLGDGDRWAFAAGPLAELRFGREDVDDRAVRALGDIDDAIEIGAFFRIDRLGVLSDSDAMGLEFSYQLDVSDAHDGSIGRASAIYSFSPAENLSVELETGLTFGDDNYMEAYFGVTPTGAARSGLRRFDADAGIRSIPTTVSASYAFSADWSVVGFATLEQLVGDAADSPIVDDRGSASQLGGGLAIMYAF